MFHPDTVAIYRLRQAELLADHERAYSIRAVRSHGRRTVRSARLRRSVARVVAGRPWRRLRARPPFRLHRTPELMSTTAQLPAGPPDAMSEIGADFDDSHQGDAHTLRRTHIDARMRDSSC